jgi:NADPH-dependent 2,4-dienoyl-CoA reductase/sulfur reductase-like enzyme
VTVTIPSAPSARSADPPHGTAYRPRLAPLPAAPEVLVIGAGAAGLAAAAALALLLAAPGAWPEGAGWWPAFSSPWAT